VRGLCAAICVLVVAPVVLGLRFGVRVTVALYAFEVILLMAMSVTILARGDHAGLSGAPFHRPGGSTDVFLTFSLAVLAVGGSKPPTRWPRRPRTPGATCRSRSSARCARGCSSRRLRCSKAAGTAPGPV